MARTTWERAVADLYPNTMNKTKEASLRQFNSIDVADIRNHRPQGMKAKVWDGLVDTCFSLEWKMKFEVA